MKDEFDFTPMFAAMSAITIELVDALPGAISWVLQTLIGIATLWYIISKIKHLKKK